MHWFFLSKTIFLLAYLFEYKKYLTNKKKIKYIFKFFEFLLN